MHRKKIVGLIVLAAITSASVAAQAGATKINVSKLIDNVRAKQVTDMKFGMFICWSFSTFYGQEWTPTQDKDASFFKATGCDTDQWCKTAKAAGMDYILFLAKHHDGFCLWDTATTEKKVTNSPLGIDVLAKLRKSCDKYGIKLALYFSEGDWNWPGAVDGAPYKGGNNPEMKKAQLKELLTRYGPIEFWWMDHAAGTGGLNHADTVAYMHKFQPNTFVGFNHGEAAGRLCLREMGRPGKIGDKSATRYNKDAEGSFNGYQVAEFTYPILPPHQGGAMWFYSLPEHDDLCLPAKKIYRDYVGAVHFGNIFSLDVGPDYAGRIRDIDVRTLTEVGRMIREKTDLGFLPWNSIQPVKATSSSIWNEDYGPSNVSDSSQTTRWGAADGSREGWLELDLGKEQTISKAFISEAGFNRSKQFAIEYKNGKKWKTIATGSTIGHGLELEFDAVKARYVRLNILKANEVPTISIFQVYP